jgi:hypothetical protein
VVVVVVAMGDEEGATRKQHEAQATVGNSNGRLAKQAFFDRVSLCCIKAYYWSTSTCLLHHPTDCCWLLVVGCCLLLVVPGVGVRCAESFLRSIDITPACYTSSG